MARDGWHTVYGNPVYVENGKVVRGMKKDHNGGWVAAFPYKASLYGGWTNVSGYYTLEQFRSGMSRGTKILM